MTLSNFYRVIILMIILTLPFTSKAEICFKSFEEDTTVSKAIFVGKVIKIEEGKYWYRGRPKTIFTFEVLESFKGLQKGIGHLSLIGAINGCCNENFIVDSTFLVFAYSDCENSSILWTNDCSNTGLLSKQIVNYQKLGNAIQHVRTNDEFNSEQSQIDSLYKRIENLEISLKKSQASNGNLNVQRIVLSIAIGVLFIITAAMAAKRKKRNAHNS